MAETPESLAESLAESVGLSTDPECDFVIAGGVLSWRVGDRFLGHTENCLCRIMWVPAMADRIRKAAANEFAVDLLDSLTRTLAEEGAKMSPTPHGTLFQFQPDVDATTEIVEQND